jgi:site-specific DNA-methyltransferase (adenine-specific)
MINIYNQDCLEAMREMSDKQFDLAIVDPPYGIGNWVQQSGNKRGKPVTWNDNTPTQEYFKELQRVSIEQIIWGANYYNCFNTKGGAIIWNKGVKRETNFSVCEIASYSRLKRVDYVKIKWQNINRAEITIHPCQKPIALYEWLLMNYAKEGDKILDTHLGSGSIAIACHNLGYDLEGYELDKEYYDNALKRIKEHQSQLRLI